MLFICLLLFSCVLIRLRVLGENYICFLTAGLLFSGSIGVVCNTQQSFHSSLLTFLDNLLISNPPTPATSAVHKL